MSDDSMKAIQKIQKEELRSTALHLHVDTKGEEQLLHQTVENIQEIKSRIKYGILRCDYEYIPTRGDPGDPTSFTCDTNIIKVEGWTFESVQLGMTPAGKYPASEFRIRKADGSVDEYWSKLWHSFPDANGSAAARSGYVRVTEKRKDDTFTEGIFDEDDYIHGEVYRYEPDVVENKMKLAVKHLEESGVIGITADVGYSQAFQASVRDMTKVPVVLSSLQQLSFISKMYDFRPESGNKIMIMTANSNTFDRNKLIPADVNQDCIFIVGSQVGDFGKWVAEGRSFSRFEEDATDEASVEKGLESLCALCRQGIDQVECDGGRVVCLLQECAEMPAYSNALRRRFKLPVYDTMTAIDFVKMANDFTLYSGYMM